MVPAAFAGRPRGEHDRRAAARRALGRPPRERPLVAGRRPSRRRRRHGRPDVASGAADVSRVGEAVVKPSPPSSARSWAWAVGAAIWVADGRPGHPARRPGHARGVGGEPGRSSRSRPEAMSIHDGTTLGDQGSKYRQARWRRSAPPRRTPGLAARLLLSQPLGVARTAADGPRGRRAAHPAGERPPRSRGRAGAPGAPVARPTDRRSTAARIASSSNALIAWTRPRWSGSSGATGSGTAPSRPIRAATSTTAAVRQVRQRPVVPDVHHLDVARVRVERRDELRGGLAVVGAAATGEQLRLRVQRRVAVQLQQLAARCR